ncbi:MAG: hypothetical protein CL678_05650 [Bdellovibrionaceae bacterium]|nr:hypothetical protein [Pseudobdellovibrionaceae bacterium]
MKNVLKLLKKTSKKFIKLNCWTKIALIMGVILVILMIANHHKQKKEGFAQQKKYVLKENNDIYDEFYCSLYDDLVYDPNKNKFEIDEIKYNIKPNKSSKILDIGSGGGHHVNLFNKEGYKVEGLDKSKFMVDYAKKRYNKCNFKHGDATDAMVYSSNSFTTITCLYFTIYYIKNKKQFLQNCYDWLKPGGYLVIHLVNRDKFDPILNSADPLQLVSAQRHAKSRITNSLVKFKDFQYKANFNLDKTNNLAEFDETFKDDTTGHIRQNKHKLHMETQKHILSIAKNIGFILHGKIDMVSTQYQYQYLYVLYKPE